MSITIKVPPLSTFISDSNVTTLDMYYFIASDSIYAGDTKVSLCHLFQ